MSIKAIEGFAPVWYTPDGQDDDAPTRFKLQPLDGEQYGDVAGHIDVYGGVVRITGEGYRVCLKYGLVDWENFDSSDGPIPFSPSKFRLLRFSLRNKLVLRILEMSDLNGDEEKN